MLAVDPATSTTLYADDQLLYTSTDGAQTWTPVSGGLEGASVLSLAIHPTVTTTMYAGTQQRGLLKTITGGR